MQDTGFDSIHKLKNYLCQGNEYEIAACIINALPSFRNLKVKQGEKSNSFFYFGHQIFFSNTDSRKLN